MDLREQSTNRLKGGGGALSGNGRDASNVAAERSLSANPREKEKSVVGAIVDIFLNSLERFQLSFLSLRSSPSYWRQNLPSSVEGNPMKRDIHIKAKKKK